MNWSVKCIIKVKHESCKFRAAGMYRRREVWPPHLQLNSNSHRRYLKTFLKKSEGCKRTMMEMFDP